MDFDMETTLRINNLARELLKSGAAASSADAHMKAEKIILAESGRRPEASSISSASSSQSRVQAESARQPMPMPPGEYEKLANYNERIMRELSMIKLKVDELQKSVNSLAGLSRDMDALKSFIAANIKPMERIVESRPQAMATQQPVPHQQQAQQQTPQEPQPTDPEGQKKSMHPRCGGYSSEDVAINKFFYSGGK